MQEGTSREKTNVALFPGWCGLLVLMCLVLPSPTQGAEPDGDKPFTVKVVKDITYYEGPDQHKYKHRLDLYVPEGAKDFPVLFFVHGGGWAHGDKNFLGIYAMLAKTYARQGVGVVVTNYRLSPEVKHPEHIKDVARAFAWTYRNIGKYGGKADCIFACGHSAGGHLVSLLTTDETYLKACGLSTKAIRGVIPISGVFSIPDRFLPSVFGTQAKRASPLAHVRTGLPPFLILYADKDIIGCDRGPAEAFCKALKGKKADAQTLEIKKSDHFRIIFSAARPDNVVSRAILKFVRTHSEK
jgi:acetyl esterase/lipase